MKEKEVGIKNFFNSVGFSAALMAGFSFTGILEMRAWEPTYFTHIALLKEATLFFMVISFLVFLMPILLNMCFLNVPIEDEQAIQVARKIQLSYTILIGLGVGCLEGAFCLFMLGTFSFTFTLLAVSVMIVSLLVVFVIMRRYRKLFSSKGVAKQASSE